MYGHIHLLEKKCCQGPNFSISLISFSLFLLSFPFFNFLSQNMEFLFPPDGGILWKIYMPAILTTALFWQLHSFYYHTLLTTALFSQFHFLPNSHFARQGMLFCQMDSFPNNILWPTILFCQLPSFVNCTLLPTHIFGQLHYFANHTQLPTTLLPTKLILSIYFSAKHTFLPTALSGQLHIFANCIISCQPNIFSNLFCQLNTLFSTVLLPTTLIS